MKKVKSEVGLIKIYTPAETAELFVPLRDRIFDMSGGGLDWNSQRIFNDDSWVKVIIRGGVYQSDRSGPRRPYEVYETLEDWKLDDPRDELRPLFDLMIEDDIFETIIMTPYVHDEGDEAAVTRPTSAAVRGWLSDLARSILIEERILFDQTGRWGMYGMDDMFGLLGGEQEFMERFIARSGGMAFIREKADYFWQSVIDHMKDEVKWVPHYYKLAGWDNPPRRREEKP